MDCDLIILLVIVLLILINWWLGREDTLYHRLPPFYLREEQKGPSSEKR